jgi:hypothetical protein
MRYKGTARGTDPHPDGLAYNGTNPALDVFHQSTSRPALAARRGDGIL